MSTRDDDERMSLRIAWAVVAAGVFDIVVGLTHWNTAAKLGYPGRGTTLLGGMAIIGAVYALVELTIRIRHAERLSKEEEPRLSPGQRTARRQRGARLGRHLFDIEADRIPDGEAALNAWLDGRAIGPPEGTVDSNVVGVYQAADTLRPLFGPRAFNSRMGLLIFGLGTVFLAVYTLFA